MGRQGDRIYLPADPEPDVLPADRLAGVAATEGDDRLIANAPDMAAGAVSRHVVRIRPHVRDELPRVCLVVELADRVKETERAVLELPVVVDRRRCPDHLARDARVRAAVGRRAKEILAADLAGVKVGVNLP